MAKKRNKKFGGGIPSSSKPKGSRVGRFFNTIREGLGGVKDAVTLGAGVAGGVAGEVLGNLAGKAVQTGAGAVRGAGNLLKRDDTAERFKELEQRGGVSGESSTPPQGKSEASKAGFDASKEAQKEDYVTPYTGSSDEVIAAANERIKQTQQAYSGMAGPSPNQGDFAGRDIVTGGGSNLTEEGQQKLQESFEEKGLYDLPDTSAFPGAQGGDDMSIWDEVRDNLNQDNNNNNQNQQNNNQNTTDDDDTEETPPVFNKEEEAQRLKDLRSGTAETIPQYAPDAKTIQRNATYTPEDQIQQIDEQDDVTAGSATAKTFDADTATVTEGKTQKAIPTDTYTSVDARRTGPTRAAQGRVTREAEAEEATLTERAVGAGRDATQEEEAMATAAQRPEARDYATGVTTDERFEVIEAEKPEVATRIAQTISEREKQDLMAIVSKEGTNLDDIPEFSLAERRKAAVGEAASRIAQELGTAPSVDLQGRQAITGTAPQGDASQIGGIPTMQAASREAITGPERSAAAEDMMAVVGNLPAEVTAAISEDPATLEAQLDTGADPAVVAAVAALPEEALVSTQMSKLLEGMEEGQTPAWARPAVAQIEQMMAQRGMSASTVGRDALFNAIIQSALPMAQSNAQALQQRAQQNLSNEQQANLASAQNTMQIRMQNLSNRQTAASQTANMAQQIKVQQSQFRQEAAMTGEAQTQQTEMANFQAAQQRAQQESAQRQQTALANLDSGSRMDLANLEALNRAGAENLNAEQQARLTTYRAQVDRTMRQAELTQDMEKANLSTELQMELSNLTEQNAAARDTMTAENQERLTNLNTLVDFKKTNANLAQQMDMANMNAEQQMELAMLSERAATDAANMTEANRFKLERLTVHAKMMSENTELRQRAELAQLSAAEKVELSNLTAQNQADSESMSAENVAELQVYEKKMQAGQVNAQLAQQMGLANLSNKQSAAMFNAQIDANMDMRQFDANQQVQLANSQFMQTMTVKDMDNRQQAAMQNATALASMDMQNADARTKASIANAQNFLAMDTANLNNRQQATVMDQQMRQQRILSNQAAENAARQFNSTSINQTNQFNANMAQNMEQFNTTQKNSMEQFNATEKNRAKAINAQNETEVSKANAQLLTQTRQFNAQVDFQREQWNAANAQAIEQSNVEWRRKANTIDTAAQNAVNQQNAQNTFAITQQAQSQIWQEVRDQATREYSRELTRDERAISMANTALGSESFMTQDRFKEQRKELFELLKDLTGMGIGYTGENQ